MRKNNFSLISAKFEVLLASLRIYYYRLLGLSTGKDLKLGRIICKWPNCVTIGNNCEIQDGVLFRIQRPFHFDNFIEIGDKVFIGNNCEFNSTTSISIGNNCLIASNTIIVDAGHGVLRATNINEQEVLGDKITIEDDVWLGTNCKILKGVTISKGSVVGAGSVVIKSIPPYEIWAGVPAKFIKKRI